MLSENVRQIIQKFHLIPHDERLIVGISGGADSLALLHLLHGLSFRMNFHIHAATLDHQLRGAESAADARFVIEWCAAHGIPITAGAADVRALATREKLSIEMAARRARYDFLAAVARQHGAKRIAVGHHADDQAETVLLHLLRGSGGRGLAGMALQALAPGHPDLLLIRPLLNTTRAEIETYCREHGLTAREDDSNADTRYLRNHVRHIVLPSLEQINARARQVLAQTAEIAAVEEDYWANEVERAAAQISQRSAGRVVIDRAAFRDLHPALARRLLVAAARALVPAAELDYAHITAAVELGRHGGQGAIALLRGGLRLRVDYARLHVETVDAPDAPFNGPLLDPGTSHLIPIPGTAILGTWELQASLTPFPEAENMLRLAAPPDARFTLRTRRTGDRFAPLGMGGHTQSVSRWMSNRKIPRAVRDRLPLLCVDDRVAAISIGEQWSLSEDYALSDFSPGFVYFQFRHSS